MNKLNSCRVRIGVNVDTGVQEGAEIRDESDTVSENDDKERICRFIRVP